MANERDFIWQQQGASSFVKIKMDWARFGKIHFSFVQHSGKPACKQVGFLDVAELCQRADGNRIAIVPYVSGIRNLLQVYKQFRIIRQQVLFQGSDQIRTSGNRLGFFI